MLTTGVIIVKASVALSGAERQQQVLLSYLQNTLSKQLEVLFEENSKALLDGEVEVSFISNTKEYNGQ